MARQDGAVQEYWKFEIADLRFQIGRFPIQGGKVTGISAPWRLHNRFVFPKRRSCRLQASQDSDQQQKAFQPDVPTRRVEPLLKAVDVAAAPTTSDG